MESNEAQEEQLIKNLKLIDTMSLVFAGIWSLIYVVSFWYKFLTQAILPVMLLHALCLLFNFGLTESGALYTLYFVFANFILIGHHITYAVLDFDDILGTFIICFIMQIKQFICRFRFFYNYFIQVLHFLQIQYYIK